MIVHWTMVKEGRSEAGFSLIEVLIALVLFSLMAALLTGTIASARKALAFVEMSNAASPVAAAQGYLHSALAQARSKARIGVTDDSQLSFVGDKESMSFITSYAPRGQYDGLYHVTIGLQPSAGQSGLFDLVAVQTFDRPSTSNQPQDATLHSILIENIISVAFSYLGALEDQNKFQWQDSWSQLYRLPALVAIDVRFAKGDARIWHRLNVLIYASDSSAVSCPPRTTCL